MEYLFTDKTGTMTENQMEFRQFSVGGFCYEEKAGMLWQLSDTPGVEPTAVRRLTVSTSCRSLQITIWPVCYKNTKLWFTVVNRYLCEKDIGWLVSVWLIMWPWHRKRSFCHLSLSPLMFRGHFPLFLGIFATLLPGYSSLLIVCCDICFIAAKN